MNTETAEAHELRKAMRRAAFENKKAAMADGLRERADRYDHRPTRGAQRQAAIAENLAEWED